MPVNYQQGKIYQIICNITNDVYIGSTCEPTLARRLAKHNDCYKTYLKGLTHFVTSYIIIERGDYNIYLIEHFPCDSKDELTKREGHVIKKMKSEFNVVNRNIPGRTKQEYQTDNANKIKEYRILYYIDNRDKIKDKNNKYYAENADKINEIKKNKFTCVCGSVITFGVKARHERIKKHIDLIKSK